MSTFDWSKEQNKCFACGENPWGLGLEFERKQDWLVASTTLHDNYQGFQNSAHGGIIATLLDEAAAWVAMVQTGRVAPSFSLDCRFRNPVPLGEEITVRAKPRSLRHGVVTCYAEVVSGSQSTLASAEVKCKVQDESPTLDQKEYIQKLNSGDS